MVTLCNGKHNYDAIIVQAYYECLSTNGDGTYKRYVEHVCPKYSPLIKKIGSRDPIQCWNPTVHGKYFFSCL